MRIDIKDILNRDEEEIKTEQTADEVPVRHICGADSGIESETGGKSDTDLNTVTKEKEAAVSESDFLRPDESKAESEEDDEIESEAADEPETLSDTEAEIDTEQNPEQEHEPADENRGFRKYLDSTVIATAFVILMAVVFCYTQLVPRDVNAAVNGRKTVITTRAWTVEEFLEEQGISYCSEDYISVPLTGFVYDGIYITINHAADFNVTADGKTREYKTLEKTVGEALEEEKIRIGEDDIVEPELDVPVTDGMTIVVKRVAYKEKTVVEKIPYKTIRKDDPSMNDGEEKVVRKGKNGKASVTYRIKYIDGIKASKKKIGTKVLEKKQNKIINVGTRKNINGFAYTRTMTVKAYAYTGGGRTAMGTSARVGEIAVDPSVIPLGTSVYIEGVGVRRAEDTGGNIKGNTIDIYMNSQSECLSWGCRYITIYLP